MTTLILNQVDVLGTGPSIPIPLSKVCYTVIQFQLDIKSAGDRYNHNCTSCVDKVMNKHLRMSVYREKVLCCVFIDNILNNSNQQTKRVAIQLDYFLCAQI